jgi:ABC-type nitrate/sulfonate/bicarbonate transport system ATPase subunit
MSVIDATPDIRFQRVTRRFRTPSRPAVDALREVDLHGPPGRITAVVGPSGCGKTTLLRLAAGLDAPTSGRVCIGDRVVEGPDQAVGLLSQEGTLLPWRRVRENVELGLEVRGVGRRQRHRRAVETIRRVGLPGDVLRSYPHELSGGMRQRVALARALCPGPSVVLMDEPFASLDEPTRHRLQDEVLHQWQLDPRTVLLVTHDIEEAVTMADRVVVMTFGRPVAEVPVDLPHPRDRLGEDFVRVLLAVRRALTEHANP